MFRASRKTPWPQREAGPFEWNQHIETLSSKDVMTKELIWRFGEDWSQRDEQRDQVRGKLRCSLKLLGSKWVWSFKIKSTEESDVFYLYLKIMQLSKSDSIKPPNQGTIICETCSPKQTFKYRPKVYLIAWRFLAPQRSNHL